MKSICQNLWRAAQFNASALNAIKWHVKDASGAPIMSATITVNGKAVGITDMNGNFSVDAAPGAKTGQTH